MARWYQRHALDILILTSIMFLQSSQLLARWRTSGEHAMATILVTGASGFVGSHVVPALIDAGHRVVGLVRTDEDAALVRRRLSPGAARTPRDADRRRHRARRRSRRPSPASTRSSTSPPSRATSTAAQSLRLVNTEGTRNVVHAAREAGVRRFVHHGALGVVDDPDLHYASSKAKAMAIVRDSGLDWTVLAPVAPVRAARRVLQPDRRARPDVAGRGPDHRHAARRGSSRWRSRTWRGSWSRCSRTTRPSGSEYPLGGPRYWTYREIVEEVLRAMGKRRVLVPMPVPVIRLVAGAAEFVRLPFPVATDQLRQLKFDNIGPLDAVAVSAFGFEPRPMEGGLAHVRVAGQGREPGASRRAPAVAATPALDRRRLTSGARGPTGYAPRRERRRTPDHRARHRLARARGADRAGRGRDRRRR